MRLTTTDGARVIPVSRPRVPREPHENVDSPYLFVRVVLMSSKALDDSHLP